MCVYIYIYIYIYKSCQHFANLHRELPGHEVTIAEGRGTADPNPNFMDEQLICSDLRLSNR